MTNTKVFGLLTKRLFLVPNTNLFYYTRVTKVLSINKNIIQDVIIFIYNYFITQREHYMKDNSIISMQQNNLRVTEFDLFLIMSSVYVLSHILFFILWRV